MNGTLLIYRPDNSLTRIDTDEGEAPTLEALRAAIDGGYLEEVPGFRTIEIGRKRKRCVAFCDEEGKLKGLPHNEKATALWWSQHRTGDVLVGPVVVVSGDKEFMEAL